MDGYITGGLGLKGLMLFEIGMKLQCWFFILALSTTLSRTAKLHYTFRTKPKTNLQMATTLHANKHTSTMSIHCLCSQRHLGCILGYFGWKYFSARHIFRVKIFLGSTYFSVGNIFWLEIYFGCNFICVVNTYSTAPMKLNHSRWFRSRKMWACIEKSIAPRFSLDTRIFASIE